MNIHSPLYLFFDLDGTVLVNHKLPPKNLAAMKRAQAMGHKLILNTGRSRGGYALVPEANAIPWDGMCFSASDIMYEGRDISHVTVSEKDFHIWLEYCMTYRVRLAYCGREWLEYLDFTVYSEPLTEAEKNKHRAYADELYAKNPLTNVSVHSVIPPETIPPESGITPIQLSTYADLFPAGSSKGKVIEDFCAALHVPIEQCVCFGDSANDVDMFRVCPTSYAMSYAPDELKRHATYVATGEYGVAEGLSHLLGFSLDEE
ncbi:MAG: HAD family phosphatase, partial [Clostridia bacterium]|nr:HAD family phosphatase [Clostridia bacterium]